MAKKKTTTKATTTTEEKAKRPTVATLSEQVLYLTDKVEELSDMLQDACDDGKINSSVVNSNVVRKASDTLVTDFRFFSLNTAYKLAFWIILALAVYYITPVIFNAINKDEQKKEEVSTLVMSQADYDVTASAVKWVNGEISKGQIDNVADVKDAIYSNVPTKVRDQVVAKIPDVPINEMPAKLDFLVKGIIIR